MHTAKAGYPGSYAARVLYCKKRKKLTFFCKKEKYPLEKKKVMRYNTVVYALEDHCMALPTGQ